MATEVLSLLFKINDNRKEVIMTENYEDGRVSSVQERINLLHEQGYRGFNPSGSQKKWDGVMVSVVDKHGKELTAEGETQDEAYENVIELIDYTLDDIDR